MNDLEVNLQNTLRSNVQLDYPYKTANASKGHVNNLVNKY